MGNTYLIGFQGVTRQLDGGEGVSRLKVVGDATFNASGGATVATRMDGVNYYGFEETNIRFGSGTDVLNVQGTSAGSFKGVIDSLSAVHAATNITLANGNDQVFVSSNADLDAATINTTAGAPDVFEFLTGDLNAVRGNLNLDLGAGRHRLLVSDEAATAGDSAVTISDTVGTPTGAGGFDKTTAAEIQMKGLAFGDITYGVAPAGDLLDGVIYWSGSGNDTIAIDGTHNRPATGKRTSTVLNTGLGNDHVTVNLTAGQDGFFVLNTSGGSVTDDPLPIAATPGPDDDVVNAAGSTLPLVIFSGYGNDDVTGGQGADVIFGDFGRVQYVDPATEALIATFGFGGRGDKINDLIVDPRWVISRHLTIGGSDTVRGQGDEDVLVGGAGSGHAPGAYDDAVDGEGADDLIFGDAVRLFRRDVNVAGVGTVPARSPTRGSGP